MLKYRKQQAINFSIDFLEKIFKQTQIFVEHLDSQHPMQQDLKSEAIRIGAKIDQLSKQYDELEKSLYDGQPKFSEHINKESPHKDEETNGQPDLVHLKEEEKIPDSFKENLLAQKEDRRSEVTTLKVRSSEFDKLIRKQNESQARLKLLMPNISNSSPGYCILKEKHMALDCYDEVLSKIQDEGLDQMDPFIVTYKKYDVYRIIAKVAKVEEVMVEVKEGKK